MTALKIYFVTTPPSHSQMPLSSWHAARAFWASGRICKSKGFYQWRSLERSKINLHLIYALPTRFPVDPFFSFWTDEYWTRNDVWRSRVSSITLFLNLADWFFRNSMISLLRGVPEHSGSEGCWELESISQQLQDFPTLQHTPRP